MSGNAINPDDKMSDATASEAVEEREVMEEDEQKENVPSAGNEPEKSQISGGDNSNQSSPRKNYKITLCQYYLKGPCQNGDTCGYAHGTSELRTPSGVLVSEVAKEDASNNEKYKTTLCSRFVTDGYCHFGGICNFAHGVQDLRNAVESVVQESNHGPNYKTSLCKHFMTRMYCPFAEKCQFAHGRHELRQDIKPVAPLTEEEKQRRLEKANTMPGYKTKLCQNYANGRNSCEFGDICLFAHGQDELRGDGDGEVESQKQRAPMESSVTYKTTLCKHFMETGSCPFGIRCQFAHGHVDVRSPGNHKFRTQLCQHMLSTGFCPRGPNCSFAHSRSEQRSSSTITSFGVLQKIGQQTKFKTTMCTNVMNDSGCPRGDDCHFAHSLAEMKAAQRADPRYKTEMCTNWMKSGFCERGNNCKFAHGEMELRPVRGATSTLPNYISAGPPMGPMGMGGGPHMVKQMNMRGPPLAPLGGLPRGGPMGGPPMGGPVGGPPMGGPPMGGPPMGGPPMGGSMQVDNYKTVMCKHFASGTCQRGDACSFAHSMDELRTAAASSSTTVDYHHGSNVGGGPRGPSWVPGKRKQGPFGGAQLCQNLAMHGHCQYGDSCLYAHSEVELSLNKRQRF